MSPAPRDPSRPTEGARVTSGTSDPVAPPTARTRPPATGPGADDPAPAPVRNVPNLARDPETPSRARRGRVVSVLRRDTVVLTLVAVAIVAVLAAIQLFLPPVIGLADNGSYQQVMRPAGIAHIGADDEAATKFDYLQTDYLVDDDNPPGADAGVVSSERLVARAARAIDGVISDPTFLDIREIGGLNLLLLLAGVGLFLLATSRMRRFAWIVAGAVLAFAISDVGYVTYLNSFYGQTAAIFGLLLALGGAVFLATAATRGAALAGGGVFVLASLATITASPDTPLLALPLAVLGVVAIWQRRDRLVPVAAGALAAVVLLGAGAWAFASVPTMLQEVGRYNVVFVDLLPNSDDPGAVLSSMGLDPALAENAGVPFYDPASPREDDAFRAAFFDRVGTGTLLSFFATHPGELTTQLARNADRALSLRPDGLGNLTIDAADEPGQQAGGHLLWSSVHDLVLPGSIGFVGGVLVLALALSVLDLVRRRDDPTATPYAVPGLLALIAVAAGVAYAGPVLLQGESELTLRMAPFNLLFDLSLIGIVAWLLSLASSDSAAWAQDDTDPADEHERAKRARAAPRVRP